MKCPKCGGEIPFYDLRPNCKHCGVNIFYYSQDTLLARDAKRTELESAVARMVVARIKATFIGGGLQIARMVFVLAAAAALMLPFGTLKLFVPLDGSLYSGNLAVGLIGVIREISGLVLLLPKLLSGAVIGLDAKPLAMILCLAFLLVLTVIVLLVLLFYLLSFTDPDKCTKSLRNLTFVGFWVALAAQGASCLMLAVTHDTTVASFRPGFGGAAVAVLFLVLFFLNRALLKKGITPTYREYDLKRKALLKQVRAGEVDLDSLPLPVFESEEEHEERMKALHQALQAEGEE